MTERKTPRFTAHLRIFFSDKEVEGEGTVVDLSKAGCKVESETMIPINTEVEIWLYPPDHDWPLKVERAVVRWVTQQRFGIEFLQMQPAQRERLRLVLDGRKLKAAGG